MSILTDKEIEQEIDSRSLILKADKSNIQACSYDMTIGTIFTGDGDKINNAHEKAKEPKVIKPGEIVSFFTEEELDLPDNISATAFAMNSWSSKGLLVLNPGHIDPGYKGPLTVKAINLTKTSLSVERGSEIFTVIFDKLESPADKPYDRNKKREVKERKYNEDNVVNAPKSLADLIVFTENNPFPTKVEIDKIVKEHWLSRLSITVMVITFIAAIVAAVASVYSIVNGEKPDFFGETALYEMKSKINELENKLQGNYFIQDINTKVADIEEKLENINVYIKDMQDSEKYEHQNKLSVDKKN